MVENINNFVIDSSFLLSILLPDEMSTSAAKLGKDLMIDSKNKFYAPKLLEFEVLNGIKSAILSKRIKTPSINDVLVAFKRIPIHYIEIDIQKVLSLSIKHELSFYDASYLYLAKVNKCKLLTLDKKLIEIAK